MRFDILTSFYILFYLLLLLSYLPEEEIRGICNSGLNPVLSVCKLSTDEIEKERNGRGPAAPTPRKY